MISPVGLSIALGVVLLISLVPFSARTLFRRRGVEALRQVELVVFSDDPMVKKLIDRSLCSFVAACPFHQLERIVFDGFGRWQRDRVLRLVDMRTLEQAKQLAEMVRLGSPVLMLVPVRARRARRIRQEKGILGHSRAPNTEDLRQALLQLLEA